MDAFFQGTLVKSNRIIYTPSAFAKSNLLYLQETGRLQAQKPHTSTRSGLLSYLFFLVLDGSGTLTYQGREYDLTPGDCVFIDCKKTYSHRSSEALWTLQWIHFYGSNLSGIYEKYVARGGLPVFHPSRLQPFQELLEQLYHIAGSSDHIRDMHIFEKIASLLTLLMAESWHGDSRIAVGSKKQSLQQVKDHLDAHYRDKISLDNLAEQFYINKFYLTRIFKEQYGVSINGYLAQARVTHAKQLLRFTDMTIEQVGVECGIEEPAYFARVFRKVEGIPPGEYRKQW